MQELCYHVEMRILHLPVASGRQAWGLSQAEKRAGLQSRVLVFEDTIFRLNCDEILFAPNDGIFNREMKRWNLFLSSIFKYDVFHFHFGQKFFVLFPRPWKKGDSTAAAIMRLAYWTYALFVGKLDIWILKLLGKKIFMTYHGDDIRQGDRSRKLYKFSIAQHVGEDYYDDYSDARKRRMGRYYQRVCDQVYVVSPDLLAMAPPGAKLVHYTGVRAAEWYSEAARSVTATKRKIMIAHAPTHRLVKGTQFIENAIAALKRRGFDFDFVLVEKLANDEARKIYEKADIVIDQLLAGWYGVFAVELMALGKPVIAYIRQEDLEREPIEFQKDFPVVKATPEDIESVLAELLEAPEALAELGQRSQNFVTKWYDPDKIAASVIEDYFR